MQGLTDRSRRPYRYANQLPFQVENYVLNVKREHPSWGARKIRERLIRRFSGIPIPAKSTIMRCGIVTDWSSAAAVCVIVRKEPLSRWDSVPTSYGAPTTKASSCWATTNIAIR
jgi:hypothetical protein